MAAFRNQKYSKIKKDQEKNGELFIDSEFPPSNKSLFFSKIDNEIEWKRPKEMCKVPQLVMHGQTADDLVEGELGNSWFVTACAALTMEPKQFLKVIPDLKEQDWNPLLADTGVFHFQFWRYGQWVDIVVDDQLPTKDGKLIFCHSNTKNEFWSALLEKAYAKLYGDYESLCHGSTVECLVDLTGGVAMNYEPKEMGLTIPEQIDGFFDELFDAKDGRALITSCIKCSREECGQPATQGLVKGHGYIVTDLKAIQLNREFKNTFKVDVLKLVRVRNPWGTKEWDGAWSDNSKEWSSLSVKDKNKMGLHFEQEGEFWMSFEDFINTFDSIDVCHFVNTSFFSTKKTWTETMLHGEWTTGSRGSDKDRVGGNALNETFLYNPQYIFDMPGVTDTLMVSLEQEDVGAEKKTGASHKKIGFHIMKVEENREYRVHIVGEKVAESEYLAKRSIFMKTKLPKGRYVLIPSTEAPGIPGRFLLRMYTSNNSKPRFVRLLDKDCPKQPLCCMKPYAMCTRVKVVKAEGLEEALGKNTMDPFVIVRCEGQAVKSMFVKNCRDPEWNFQAIFYRKKPEVNITVEVWNNNFVKDDFVAQCFIEDKDDKEDVKEFDLFGRKKEETVQKSGKLFIEVCSNDNLDVL